MHAFVNVERGPLVFARALLLRPGEVAREYVDGRRRRHYGPFATLAVLVALAALVLNLTGVQVLATEGVSAAPAALMHRHFNLVLLAQLPLLGAACALVFRAARLSLTEHMVLVAYTLSVRALLLIVTTPLVLVNDTPLPSLRQNLAFWAVWYVYFGWAASQFYAGPRWRNALRGMLVAAIGHALILALVLGVAALYERFAT